MNCSTIAALLPPAVKFNALLNKSRIFKSSIQTAFETADRLTPRVNAAGPDRFQALAETPAMRTVRALAPHNPMAGRF